MNFKGRPKNAPNLHRIAMESPDLLSPKTQDQIAAQCTHTGITPQTALIISLACVLEVRCPKQLHGGQSVYYRHKCREGVLVTTAPFFSQEGAGFSSHYKPLAAHLKSCWGKESSVVTTNSFLHSRGLSWFLQPLQ